MNHLRPLLAALLLPALPRAAAEDDRAFFETRVRPVLAESCVGCHGPDEQRAGLRLDSREGLAKGGKDGPVVVPGTPAESLLLRAIRHEWNTPMPKDAAKLPDPVIADLTEWVRRGAPWPDSLVIPPVALAEKAKRHWAYLPVVKVGPPLAPDGKQIRTAVDGFLEPGIRALGLVHAPTASKPVFLRRAAQLLTGLPPAEEDTRRWLADGAEFHDWADRVVDHYLASPRFGEKWARLWLDVARYADNKGYVFQEHRDYPYAYTYRDWVVRAFNEDLPYPEFLRRQIAADRLDLPASEQAALGFLTLGRRFINNTHLIIDDRIDVVFRGAVATTLACARCHDHKSDPFTTRDYYALHAVFSSSEEPDDKPLIGAMADTPEARAFAAELEKKAQEIHAYVATKLPDYQRPANVLEMDDNQLRKLAKPERDHVRGIMNKISEMETTSPHAPPRAMAMRDRAKPGNGQVFIRGNPDRRGEEVERGVPVFLRAPDEGPVKEGSGRLELARSLTRPGHPLTHRVWANRVWAQLIGRPLVDNLSDFGLATPPPSHPELLDWLAARLDESGGSTKDLVREICRSQAFRRSADADPASIAKDGENRQVARANRRRLDLEGFRDSVLAASGELDPAMGGRPVKIHEPPYATRRSLYGYVDRQNLPGFFRTFDFANPDTHAPRRFQTSTPGQALFALNSPFLLQQALALAARAEREAGSDPAAFVRQLHARALGRAAEPAEVEAMTAFLRGKEEEESSASSPWTQGYGAFDPGSGKVSFVPLPYFSGDQWQASAVYPDAALHYVALDAGGGHTGADDRHAAIRRWTAPFDGAVTVTGKLRRPNEKGNGVRARVVSSRAGPLGEWKVEPKGTAEVTAGPVEVRRGDTLDFLVEPDGEHSFDSFEWAPVVHEAREVEWSAEKAFGEANPSGPWAWGYGGVASDDRTVSFTPFPYYAKAHTQWQMSGTVPDETWGYALLNRVHGHTGRTNGATVIRRWTAPRGGVMAVSGTLERVGACPGEIRGRAVHARLGVIGAWTVSAQGRASTAIARVEMRPGDTVDFIAEPMDGDTCDGFRWAPVIRLPGETPRVWESGKGFRRGELAPRAQLAQVLLVCNEFMFVD